MSKKSKRKDLIGFSIIMCVLAIFVSLVIIYAFVRLNPETISQYNVFIVDVTDTLSPQQKGELINNFETYINKSPKNSWHEFYQVGSAKDGLLEPLLRSKSDYSDLEPANYLTSSPIRQKMLWQDNFVVPFKKRLAESFQTPESSESPILESIQSAAITSLKKYEAQKAPRRIILVSDLMQNSAGLSFYNGIPTFDNLLKNKIYRRARTSLDGVQFQIWKLDSRISPSEQQQLFQLWNSIINDQGAEMLPPVSISG